MANAASAAARMATRRFMLLLPSRPRASCPRALGLPPSPCAINTSAQAASGPETQRCRAIGTERDGEEADRIPLRRDVERLGECRLVLARLHDVAVVPGHRYRLAEQAAANPLIERLQLLDLLLERANLRRNALLTRRSRHAVDGERGDCGRENDGKPSHAPPFD